jgi:hexosaminidase
VSRTWIAVLPAAVLALGGGCLPAASARAPNPRPQTIPSLQQWVGSHGVFRLRKSLRVVVPRRDWRALRSTASVFAADLRLLTARRVQVVAGGARIRAGDIRLLLGAADRRLGFEGYSLLIGETVAVAAPTPTGVFYGTRTLLQLLRQGHTIGKGRARDWPRYPERGLMIDLGRRTYPARWIESEIKELSYLKLNLLHLHLTDDQRWGIASDTHPEIVSKGALTKRELRDILALATRYHVTVVPEIDMPGHMGALLAKHHELELKLASGLIPPMTPESRKLDVSNPAALRIVHQLLDEYLPLFPGQYWDVGADEYLSPADEPLYPQLQTFALQRYGPRASTKDAILGFINWVDGIVRHHGKALRAWHDELGGGGALTAEANIVADWWIDFSPLSEPRPPTPQALLAGGHRILNDGWFPTYYTGDLGPVQGMPDMRRAYESWAVNQFCGPTVNGRFLEACYVVSPDEPRNLGATINAWDDSTLTLSAIARGLAPRLAVVAQKTWNSPLLTASYATFQRVMNAVAHAPGDGNEK